MGGLVVFGVVKLFPGKKGGESASPKAAVSEYRLLPAVPSDAAILMTFSDFGGLTDLLTDTTKFFRPFLTNDAKGGLGKFIDEVRDSIPSSFLSSEAIISMHYSGELTPLLILEAPADSLEDVASISAMARSCRLQSKYFSSLALQELLQQENASRQGRLSKRGLMVISPSRTLVLSSQRHLESGSSILDKKGFPQTASQAGSKNAMFLSGAYMVKLLSSHGKNIPRSYSDFSKTVADWFSLSLDSCSPLLADLSLRTSPSPSNAFFAKLVSQMQGGELLFGSMLPFNTVSAVSLATPSVTEYLDLYKKYLDAQGSLDRYRQMNASLRDTLTGLTPEKMVVRLDVQEVTKATLRLDSGLSDILALRVGKQDPKVLLASTSMKQMREYKGGVIPYRFKGFIGAEFGSLFTAGDERYCFIKDDWLIVGGNAALRYLSDAPHSLATLLGENALSSNLPTKGARMEAYLSLSEFPAVIDTYTKPSLTASLRRTLNGIDYEPICISVLDDGTARMRVNRVEVSKSRTPVVERDTVVVVPKGPYKVINYQNWKTYTLNQAPNKSLSVRDENGKALWGIPFKYTICGYVENIDYFQSGKIQWLFAAGSRLYLFEKGSQIVNGFPVDMGKEILLGPACYDLDGNGNFRVMLLFTDNTLGYFDLHGNTAEGWQGIEVKETIKSLPEPVFVGDKVYWAVRTSIQTLFYEYEGGPALAKNSKTPMVRPDTEIQVNDDGTVSVTCYDGKVRKLKMQVLQDKGQAKADRVKGKASKKEGRKSRRQGGGKDEMEEPSPQEEGAT